METDTLVRGPGPGPGPERTIVELYKSYNEIFFVLISFESISMCGIGRHMEDRQTPLHIEKKSGQRCRSYP